MSRELPIGWVASTLNDVLLDVIGGGTPSKSVSSYFKGDFPFMTVKDMNKLHPEDTVDHITQEAIKNSSTNIIPADSLIVATRIGLGKVVRNTFPTTINQDLKALFPGEGVEKDFLARWFQMRSADIEALGTGTTVKGITLKTLLALEIDLPPANEQGRIVKKIEALMERRGRAKIALDAIPGLLDQYRQSVLTAAFRGDLTADWRISAQDKAWKEVLISQICVSITDGDHQAPPKVDAGIPFITISAMNDGVIRLDKASRYVPKSYFDKLKPTRKAQPGDILFSVTGSIGIPALVRSNDAFVFQRHIAILKPDYQQIDSKYLTYVLASNGIMRQALDVATGTAQLTIPLSGLRSFIIPLPALDEQQEIVRRINKTYNRIDKIEKEQKNTYRQINLLNQSILAKAFRGELVPQDPMDESVSILLEHIQVEREEYEEVKRVAKRMRSKKMVYKKFRGEIISVVDALKYANVPLSAQDLLMRSGYPKDVATDQLELFFLDVRKKLSDGTITRNRKGNEDFFALAR